MGCPHVSRGVPVAVSGRHPHRACRGSVMDTAEDTPAGRPRIPRFVVGVFIVALFTALTIPLGVSWWGRRECNRIADTRDDNRAMWVWLAARNPYCYQLEAFWIELNDRLPQLECEGGGHPTPVSPPPQLPPPITTTP
jgi:hypothetical protein